MNQASHREWRPLSSFELWGDNPHEGDVQAIVRSIRRFGFNEAIKVRGNRVYAGNHSVKALFMLQQAGDPMPTQIVADPTGEWLIPVVVIDHLNEEEASAFALAHNQTPRNGKDDKAKVAKILAELGSEDLLLATGYSEKQIEKLLFGGLPSVEDAMDKLKKVECPECGEEFYI